MIVFKTTLAITALVSGILCVISLAYAAPAAIALVGLGALNRLDD